jgi:hypothetical protein
VAKEGRRIRDFVKPKQVSNKTIIRLPQNLNIYFRKLLLTFSAACKQVEINVRGNQRSFLFPVT